jgi:hypothetical protein
MATEQGGLPLAGPTPDSMCCHAGHRREDPMNTTPEATAIDLYARYGTEALAIAQTHLDEARADGDAEKARYWITSCDEIRRLHAGQDSMEIDLSR